MLPGTTSFNLRNSGDTNIKSTCYISYANPFFYKTLDLHNFSFGKFRATIRFSFSLAIFGYFVFHIIRLRTNKKMKDIATCWHIARVQDMYLWFKRTKVKLINCSMSTQIHIFPINFLGDFSISGFIFIACPKSTLFFIIRETDLTYQPFLKWNTSVAPIQANTRPGTISLVLPVARQRGCEFFLTINTDSYVLPRSFADSPTGDRTILSPI